MLKRSIYYDIKFLKCDLQKKHTRSTAFKFSVLTSVLHPVLCDKYFGAVVKKYYYYYFK